MNLHASLGRSPTWNDSAYPSAPADAPAIQPSQIHNTVYLLQAYTILQHFGRAGRYSKLEMARTDLPRLTSPVP